MSDCDLCSDFHLQTAGKKLGNHTWTLLHTMASHYPKNPTEFQKQKMECFIKDLSQLYPCSYCAKHLQTYILKNPINTENKKELQMWMCVMHNDVNVRLNKPIFDCNKF